ncbi:FxSxx-COOH system tetratricopeptide repeat protein [Spirillospora sp. CA-142024]|uniref:FxSxx-COOH system tetratricopeptide repeat protein n=1 Tax=Spirillospora sp. CA-142024 TaxID=3240036 RepID=UPI003D92EB0B
MSDAPAQGSGGQSESMHWRGPAAAAGMTILVSVLAVVTNIATGLLPDWEWLKNSPIMWAIVAGLTAISAVLTYVVQRWFSSENSSTNQSAINKSRNADRFRGIGNIGSAAGGAIGSVHVEKIFVNEPGRDRVSEDQNTPQRVITNIPARGRHFVGRDSILSMIESRIAEGPIAVVAVHGLGGIGKTQLALEYCHLHMNSYAIVWWVRAETPVTIRADLTRLAVRLAVGDLNDELRATESAIEALSNRDDWLLVFDNAESASALRPYLPSASGNIVITSRARGWEDTATCLEVEQLELSEAVQLLRQRTNRNEPDAATDLSEELGCLPLALSQAAAYISTHSMSVQSYLDLYRASAGRLLGEAPLPGDYPRSVAVTWRLHFDSLRENSPAAVDLLKVCAFLNPDEMPLLLLLKNAGENSLTAAVAAANRDPLLRERMFGALVGSSLLTRFDDEKFRIHRLVQRVLLLEINEEEAVAHCRRIVALLKDSWPKRGARHPSRWSVTVQLFPHCLLLFQYAELLDVANEDLGDLYYGVADFSIAVDAGTAIDLTERALEVFESLEPVPLLKTANVLGRLASLLWRAGEGEAAKVRVRQLRNMIDADQSLASRLDVNVELLLAELED